MKIFKKPLWITLTAIFNVLFIASIIGGSIANVYKRTINSYFDLKNYDIETVESDEEIDAEYFKSKYVQKDEENEIIYAYEDKNNYSHQVYDNLALIEQGKKSARQVQREGATILWNNSLNSQNTGLPLKDKDSVSLFGRTSAQYVNSGDGSGNSIYFYTINVKNYLEDAGLNVNNTLWNFYKTGDGSGYKPTDYEKPNEVPWSKYNSSVKNSFANYGDAAIIFLSRRAGEFKDVLTENAGTISGDYCGLSQEEKDLIENVISYKKNNTFKKVILLLNTARGLNFNDLMPYRSDIDTCMWVGQCGSYGMYEIADILVGKSLPSGHLPDTYTYNGKSAPSYINAAYSTYKNSKLFGIQGDEEVRKSRYIAYVENIYVGYKYYETRYEDCVLNQGNASSNVGAVESTSNWKYSEEVAFPFGYGGSYTEFTYSDFKVEKDSHDNYKVNVKVTNTGKGKGADAVQVYIQKPYTEYDKNNGLEQASVNLCGFYKTKELNPNESVQITIPVKYDAFKTFDDAVKDTYIREKTTGSERYYLTVGQDAHDAINNILAKKGKTPANTNNVMDGEGKASLVEEFQFAEDDYETFSVSSSGEKITTRFTDTDWNKYENKGIETITYLSRKNWRDTYPKEVMGLSLTTDAVAQLAYDSEIEYTEEDKYPLYNQDHVFNLIDMKGLEFDHEAWDTLLDQLSLKDQIEVIGQAIYGTNPIDHIASPGESVNDGPLGIRKAYQDNAGEKDRTTSFPIIPLLGASFNKDLALEVGRVMGEDILQSKTTGIYAPSANIHRNQYGGRMYEYYSEDGFLSGELCKEQTIGIQESGSTVTLKHFALNEQESSRQGVGIWANEQSIREIYLEAFRPAVEEGKAKSVMASFTRFGVKWSGACSALNNDVLRGEWGFSGYVISDCPYFDYMGILDGLVGGNDCFLYELSDEKLSTYYKAESNPKIAQLIRQSVHRVLYVTVNGNAMNGYTTNTRMKLITNWWQYALIGLQVGLGIFGVGSAVMLVLCFVYKKKKLLTDNGEIEDSLNVDHNNPIVKNDELIEETPIEKKHKFKVKNPFKANKKVNDSHYEDLSNRLDELSKKFDDLIEILKSKK